MKNGFGELCNTDHMRFPRLWIWLGVIMLSGVVLLSTIDPPQGIKRFLLQDKLVHTIVYAGLMGWFAQIFRHKLVRLVLVVLFIAMGVGVEYLQALVPSRHFDVFDMVANTCGVVLAWGLVHTRMGDILVWFERIFFPPVSFSP